MDEHNVLVWAIVGGAAGYLGKWLFDRVLKGPDEAAAIRLDMERFKTEVANTYARISWVNEITREILHRLDNFEKNFRSVISEHEKREFDMMLKAIKSGNEEKAQQ